MASEEMGLNTSVANDGRDVVPVRAVWKCVKTGHLNGHINLDECQQSEAAEVAGCSRWLVTARR